MADEFYMINKRVKDLREKSGLTQAEFAEKASLATNTIAKLEINMQQPTAATILKIANAFDIAPNYFFQDYLKVDLSDCLFLAEHQLSWEFASLSISQQKYVMNTLLDIIRFVKSENNEVQA